MAAFFPSDHMPTVEVLTSIMGVTVIVMNLYRLAVSITGFDEVGDWPLWHHISGLTEAFNYLALGVCMLLLLAEVNDHSKITMASLEQAV